MKKKIKQRKCTIMILPGALEKQQRKNEKREKVYCQNIAWPTRGREKRKRTKPERVYYCNIPYQPDQSRTLYCHGRQRKENQRKRNKLERVYHQNIARPTRGQNNRRKGRSREESVLLQYSPPARPYENPCIARPRE